MESPYSASKVTEKTEREIDELIQKYKHRAKVLDIIAAIVTAIAFIVWIITHLGK